MRVNMKWIDEVGIRIKRNNQVLFAKYSEYLQDLIGLFQNQDHKVITLWAFDFTAESISKLEEKYPEEIRPRNALIAAQEWSAGKIKMRLA